MVRERLRDAQPNTPAGSGGIAPNGLPLLRVGNCEEAIEAFTTTIASHPNEPFSYKYLGEAYQALGWQLEAQSKTTLRRPRVRPTSTSSSGA